MRRSMRSVRNATSSFPSPSRHSLAPYASPTAIRTIEIGACTPPSGTTPGMRRPVRTITLPPISSRRIRFGEPTSPRPSGVIVAAFRPSPCSRIAAAASWTTLFPVARRLSSDRSKRGKSSSRPITSARRTRSASSSSAWPVWSPSSTTIVLTSTASDYERRPRGRNPCMPRRGGWQRQGTRRPFRYLDAKGRRIQDAETIARLDALAIPPAWRDVWISPNPRAKLQATGVDDAGRRQYLYHADFRAQQEQLKYDKLIRFAEKLPDLRLAMGEHMMLDPFDPERVCAIAVRLINLSWFRVGSERYARSSQTYGVTTLRKSHVSVRRKRVTFRFSGKHKVQVRTALVDSE